MLTIGKQRIVHQRLMGESIRKRLRAFFTLLRRNGWRGNENYPARRVKARHECGAIFAAFGLQPAQWPRYTFDSTS